MHHFLCCRHIFEDKKYAEEYRADDLEASGKKTGSAGCSCGAAVVQHSVGQRPQDGWRWHYGRAAGSGSSACLLRDSLVSLLPPPRP